MGSFSRYLDKAERIDSVHQDGTKTYAAVVVYTPLKCSSIKIIPYKDILMIMIYFCKHNTLISSMAITRYITFREHAFEN